MGQHRVDCLLSVNVSLRVSKQGSAVHFSADTSNQGAPDWIQKTRLWCKSKNIRGFRQIAVGKKYRTPRETIKCCFHGYKQT